MTGRRGQLVGPSSLDGTIEAFNGEECGVVVVRFSVQLSGCETPQARRSPGPLKVRERDDRRVSPNSR
jgi:hypothetical protein